LKVEFVGEPEEILIVKEKMLRFLKKIRAVQQNQEAVRQKTEAIYVFSMRRKIKKELTRFERLELLEKLIENMR
jgi:hypothetical protein